MGRSHGLGSRGFGISLMPAVGTSSHRIYSTLHRQPYYQTFALYGRKLDLGSNYCIRPGAIYLSGFTFLHRSYLIWIAHSISVRYCAIL